MSYHHYIFAVLLLPLNIALANSLGKTLGTQKKGLLLVPLEIITVPCLSDNYAFLMHSPEHNQTALVDAPEAAPIIEELDRRGWSLDMILLTHHHYDHIDGVAALKERYAPVIVGAAADKHRLPALDTAVSDGTEFTFAGQNIRVLDVSGHTVGHIAYFVPAAKAVFTADSLMALGCGRLFEGSAAQMWNSLSKLAALPDDTIVYSGHEYTQTNARFALTIEPGNAALISRAQSIAAARASGRATVPSTLTEEKATNPFLRAHLPSMKLALSMADSDDVSVFAEIRRRKDNF